TVVALVHQGDEAPHAVIVAGKCQQLPVSGVHTGGGVFGAPRNAGGPLGRAETRYVAQQNGVGLIAEGDVIQGGERLLAQGGVTAPEDSLSCALQREPAASNGYFTWHGRRTAGQALEQGCEPVRLRYVPHPIPLPLLALMQTVILGTGQLHHL